MMQDKRTYRINEALTRRLVVSGAVAATALALPGCQDMGSAFPSLGGSGGGAPPPAPSGPITGNTLGSGPVRVALILPLTSASGASAAQSMRNAAEMALAEFNSQELTIMVKDDRGTPEGAQAAAQEAISQGAEAFMGPLFGPAVAAAAGVARASSRPVIAFSTDQSVAARGVYLLSFMPQTDVRRIVGFASARGKKSFAALIPNSPYGNVAEAEFTQAVAQSGARLVAVQRYDANRASAEGAVSRLKGSLGQADALFLPDDGNGVPAIGAALTSGGVSLKSVQLLGTGVWNESRVLKTPAVSGGWFAAPDNSGFQNFAQRYRQRFNSDPTRLATLAYDATALMSALVRTQGSQRFSETVLTNSSGFSGQDGVFRFRADGANERGLAIFQVGNGAATMLQAAPRSFGGSGA